MTTAGQLTNDELERLIQQLEGHPDVRVVRRFVARSQYLKPDGRPLAKGVVVDTETTGTRHGEDKIIELGMVAFEFDAATGEIFRILEPYNALEDPGFPIPPESTAVHGIADAMVAGQRIDDAAVSRLVEGAALVIAHNAKFDRPFLESRLPVFASLPWACSFAQVDWQKEGLGSQKLDYIVYRMGFFYDAHRAEADCLALLEALRYQLPVSGKRALKAILDQCQANDYRLWARGSRFDTKDILKERGYRWDADEKCWYKNVREHQLATELTWLKQAVYGGRAATIDCEICDAYSRFSSRPGKMEPRAL